VILTAPSDGITYQCLILLIKIFIMQKHRLKPGVSRILFLFFLTIFQFNVAGGQMVVTASGSNPEPAAGDIVDISISTMAESDLYYTEIVVLYNDVILEFISVD
jgi:hypothetical protein